MDLHSIILENKFMLEALYTFAISLICMVIVIKTDRVFRISEHNGIRYFRNAFFFFGVAFIARYIFGIFSDLGFDYASFVKIIFEYFFVMAGFFLLYSLIWKNVEHSEHYSSSLINARIGVFHAMALILAIMDVIWQTYLFMFISQALVFLYASIAAFGKNMKDKGKHKFLKFYLIAMVLSLSAWVLNLLVASLFEWNHTIMVNIGIINVIFFLLFLFGVIKFTQK